jgi:MYXO-CTERM domain-containing protein
VILIDDAVEGDTLEDVRPDALLGGGGQGGAGGGSSSTGSGGSAGVGGSSSDGGSQGVGGAAVNPLAGEDGGCGCDLPGTRAEGRLGSLAMLLMGLLALRRRRPLSDSC